MLRPAIKITILEGLNCEKSIQVTVVPVLDGIVRVRYLTWSRH